MEKFFFSIEALINNFEGIPSKKRVQSEKMNCLTCRIKFQIECSRQLIGPRHSHTALCAFDWVPIRCRLAHISSSCITYNFRVYAPKSSYTMAFGLQWLNKLWFFLSWTQFLPSALFAFFIAHNNPNNNNNWIRPQSLWFCLAFTPLLCNASAETSLTTPSRASESPKTKEGKHYEERDTAQWTGMRMKWWNRIHYFPAWMFTFHFVCACVCAEMLLLIASSFSLLHGNIRPNDFFLALFCLMGAISGADECFFKWKWIALVVLNASAHYIRFSLARQVSGKVKKKRKQVDATSSKENGVPAPIFLLQFFKEINCFSRVTVLLSIPTITATK